MSNNTTSIRGLNVIRSFEGRALRAYRDPVGVWTIGYGITNYDAGFVARYGKIGAGMSLTPEQCEQELVRSLREGYEPAVNSALPGTKQATFDAGVSFHYNTGGIKKASWPKALMRGDTSAAQASLLSWNKAGGKVLAGLTRRRRREWSMIANDDYGPEGHSGPVELNEAGRPTGKSGGALGETPALLPPAPGERVPGMLVAPGDVGPDVADVQKKLKKLGYSIDDNPGMCGPSTTAAIKDFQGKHPNLTKDGLVGPATMATITRELDLRSSVKKGTVGGAIGTVVVSTGAEVAKQTGATGHSHLSLVLVVAAVGGAVFLGWLAWKYRDEVKRKINSLLDREVP